MRLTNDLILLLLQSVIFRYALGFPDLLRASRQRFGLLPHGAAVLLFSTLCSGTAAALCSLLPKRAVPALMPLTAILICAAADFLILMTSALISKRAAKAIAPVLHGAAFSGGVLGIALLTGVMQLSISSTFRQGFHAGLGYLLVCILLQTAIPALESKQMPDCVRGERGLLLLSGLLALAAACIPA